MGQEEVLKVLKKKGWMLAGEIVAELHSSRTSVNKACRSLLKQGEVEKNVIQGRRVKTIMWRKICSDQKSYPDGSEKPT